MCCRSSCPEKFCKKGVLKNFAEFLGKHLYQSFFFNKVAGLRPATLLRQRLWHRCFPVNFVKFSRTSIFTEHLREGIFSWFNVVFFVLDTNLLHDATS